MCIRDRIGSVVGVECFQPIRDNLGARWTFIIAAICGLFGIIITYFFVPHSLENDLMKQDVEFHNYLVSNGWTGKMGFDETDKESVVMTIDNEYNSTDCSKKNTEIISVKQIEQS